MSCHDPSAATRQIVQSVVLFWAGFRIATLVLVILFGAPR
jgi:hypothetical protein